MCWGSLSLTYGNLDCNNVGSNGHRILSRVQVHGVWRQQTEDTIERMAAFDRVLTLVCLIGVKMGTDWLELEVGRAGLRFPNERRIFAALREENPDFRYTFHLYLFTLYMTLPVEKPAGLIYFCCFRFSIFWLYGKFPTWPFRCVLCIAAIPSVQTSVPAA